MDVQLAILDAAQDVPQAVPQAVLNVQGVGMLEVLEVLGLSGKAHVLVGLEQSRVDMLGPQSGSLGKIAHGARNVVEALIQHLPPLAVCIHMRGFQVNRCREVSNSCHNSSVVVVLGSVQAPALVVGIHRPRDRGADRHKGWDDEEWVRNGESRER